MTTQDVLTKTASKPIAVSRDVPPRSRRDFVVPPSQAATFRFRE